MSSNLYGSFYKSEQLPQPLRVMILHHRTRKFAPAETVSIYRDQIPALLPFCRKRLPGQIRACFIHRQIPAVACFLRRNCKRQCVCRFQPVLLTVPRCRPGRSTCSRLVAGICSGIRYSCSPKEAAAQHHLPVSFQETPVILQDTLLLLPLPAVFLLHSHNIPGNFRNGSLFSRTATKCPSPCR